MPEYTSQMVQRYFNKEIEEAENMQIEVCELIATLFQEVNPIPVKETLNLLGFKCGKPRLPLVECSEELKEKLKLELQFILNK